MASKAAGIGAPVETVLDPDSGRIFRKGKFLGKARTYVFVKSYYFSYYYINLLLLYVKYIIIIMFILGWFC